MQSRKRTWLLAAAMSLGVAGFVPVSSTLAADRDNFDEWVKYADVPKAVQRTIDNERGKNDIKRIDHVRRDGNEFYRATIDSPGSDLVIRIDRSGRVLGSDTARDKNDRDYRDVGVRRDVDRTADHERQIKFADLPRAAQDTLEKERGNRDIKSIYTVNRDGRTFYRVFINQRGNEDRMLRISENGKVLSDQDVPDDTDRARTASGVRRGLDDFDHDRIAFDRLPGEVKASLGREAGSGRVANVVKYRSRGRDVYLAEIDHGGRTSEVRVDENGRVLSEQDATPEGRQNVRFEDLPGAVRDAIGREVRRDDIRYIAQITRDGKTYYRVAVNRGGDRQTDYLTVSDTGRVVNDLDRR